MTRRIVLIVTGGIAAYKSLEVLRLWRAVGINVQPVLTHAAEKFVTPLSFGALAGTAAWVDAHDDATMPHIMLAQSADAVVVAPASADFLAHMAAGMGNSLALSCVLATKAPVFVAPAMNPAMWQHAATQRNIKILVKRGVQLIAPEHGVAACGDVGVGRLAEPHIIAQTVLQHLPPPLGKLSGKHAVVTAGATREPLDSVRCITNFSSGKQGYAIAQALWQEGATVTLISGDVSLPAPLGVHVVRVDTAAQMHAQVQHYTPCDIMVAAAAVVDRAPVAVPYKIKKENWQTQNDWHLTPDIVAQAHASCKVAFAAETCTDTLQLIALAQQKLQSKQCQMVVANNVSAEADTFGSDSSQVHFVTAHQTLSFQRQAKTATAAQLVQWLVQFFASESAPHTVLCQLLPHAVGMPQYASTQAAGLDLMASEDAHILPQQRLLMPTGVCIALPTATEAQVRPRSGLALKQGLTVLNTPGTIDADYRGEIKVLLLNTGQEPIVIKRGERIAQLVICALPRYTLQHCAALPSTIRGSNGFGSTGV